MGLAWQLLGLADCRQVQFPTEPLDGTGAFCSSAHGLPAIVKLRSVYRVLVASSPEHSKYSELG